MKNFKKAKSGVAALAVLFLCTACYEAELPSLGDPEIPAGTVAWGVSESTGSFSETTAFYGTETSESGSSTMVTEVTESVPAATATTTSLLTTNRATSSSRTQGHTHQYVSQVAAATCTAGGYTLHTCSCGNSYTDSRTPALGHRWSDWKVTVPATYQSYGEEERACSVCGEKETRNIAPLPMSNEQKQQEVFRIVNEERAKNGKAPLKYCYEAQEAADIRAKELEQHYAADHARPDGRSCFTVFDDLGLDDIFMSGENIAAGFRTPESVMEAWMNSEGHRNNILGKSGASAIVIGVNGSYWVQIFVNY